MSPTGSVTKTLVNPVAAGSKPPVHCRLGIKPDPVLSRAEIEKKKALRAEEIKVSCMPFICINALKGM